HTGIIPFSCRVAKVAVTSTVNRLGPVAVGSPGWEVVETVREKGPPTRVGFAWWGKGVSFARQTRRFRLSLAAPSSLRRRGRRVAGMVAGSDGLERPCVPVDSPAMESTE